MKRKHEDVFVRNKCPTCKTNIFTGEVCETCVQQRRKKNKIRKRKSRQLLREKKEMLKKQEEIKTLFISSMENAKKMIKHNGFVLMKKVLDLPSDNTQLFQNVIQKAEFIPVFESLDFKNGKPKSSFGTRRRRQTSKVFSPIIGKWGELENQLRTLLSSIYSKKINGNRRYKFRFTCLESLPHTPYQSVHCDHTYEGHFHNSGKEFDDLNLFISISSKPDTFLDIRPVRTSKWYHIPVSRGDIVIFRGDVAHRGVKHDGDYNHYRLHCYVDHEHQENTTTYVAVPFE